MLTMTLAIGRCDSCNDAIVPAASGSARQSDDELYAIHKYLFLYEYEYEYNMQAGIFFGYQCVSTTNMTINNFENFVQQATTHGFIDVYTHYILTLHIMSEQYSFSLDWIRTFVCVVLKSYTQLRLWPLTELSIYAMRVWLLWKNLLCRRRNQHTKLLVYEQVSAAKCCGGVIEVARKKL